MANFFAKPKAPTRTVSKEKEIVVAGSSKIQSDFDKSFKAFVLKKDTHLAPINGFLKSKSSERPPLTTRTDNGVIIIDDEDDSNERDVEMQDVQVKEVDVVRLNTRGLCLCLT